MTIRALLPALLLLMAIIGPPDLVRGGRPAGEAWLNDYMACYHQTCDAWSPNLDFASAAQDVELVRAIGAKLTNSTARPTWKPGSEFKAVRAESRGGAAQTAAVPVPTDPKTAPAREPFLRPSANGRWPNPNPHPGNPIVETMRGADPDAHVWNGRVWVYTSQDHDPAPGQPNYAAMDGYHVFSSADMVDWTDHGEIFNAAMVPWSTGNGSYLWAPGACRKHGKYYLYFPIRDKDEKWRIGLAVGKRPAGPFTEIGHPIDGPEGIDPMCFIDEDGTAYLYWGVHQVARLSADMKSLAEPPRNIEYGADNFGEGSYMFKRNGVYYYSYTNNFDKVNQGYYATGSNPYGPFDYKGAINPKPPGAQDHHSMVDFKGQWYYFYHVGNFTSSYGFPGRGNRRNTSVEYMYFNPDGTIKPIVQTREGVAKAR